MNTFFQAYAEKFGTTKTLDFSQDRIRNCLVFFRLLLGLRRTDSLAFLFFNWYCGQSERTLFKSFHSFFFFLSAPLNSFQWLHVTLSSPSKVKFTVINNFLTRCECNLASLRYWKCYYNIRTKSSKYSQKIRWFWWRAGFIILPHFRC